MGVTRSFRRAVGIAPLVLLSLVGCTTVDPGPNFVVPTVTFDSNYFYCFVEPQLIFAYKCGPGDPSLDPPNGCHFNPAAVSGMGLQDHPPVNCGNGDQVVDLTQIGTGSPAQSNFEAVSAEMSQQYMTAPLFVRPTGNNHPRQVFMPTDPVVNELLSTWASK